MSVSKRIKPDLSVCSPGLPKIHVCGGRVRVTKGSSFNWGTPMLRLALAIAIAAPLLSGCIIVSTEKPTTRVITTPASDQ
jgi:hypothetical protein